MRLRRVRSHGNSELPGPAPVHKRRGGNSPGGAYPTTAAGAAQRKYVMRRCTGRDGAGRKLHLPESSAEGPCLLAGLLAGGGSAERGGASRDRPRSSLSAMANMLRPEVKQGRVPIHRHRREGHFVRSQAAGHRVTQQS